MAEGHTGLWRDLLRLLQFHRNTGIEPLPLFGLPLGLRGGDLVALPSGVEHILELLRDEIAPDMGIGENAATRRLTSEDGYARAFHTALFAGARKAQVGGKDVTVLGLGLRRWTKVWQEGADESEALRADIEVYLPCYVGSEEPLAAPDDLPPGLRLLQMGIAVTREARSLGEGVAHDGLRFAAACPVLGDLQDLFSVGGAPARLGEPRFVAEKRTLGADTWEATTTWHADLSALLDGDDGKALLGAPVGPVTAVNLNSTFLLELIRGAGDPDRESLKEAKEKLAALRGEVRDTWRTALEEEDENEAPPPELRSFGDLLVSAGFMAEAGGKKKLKREKEITALSFASVLRNAVAEVDGMALLATGFGEDDRWRGAAQLAASPDPHDPTRSAFGLRVLGQDFFLRRAAKPLDDEDAEKERQKHRDIEVRMHFGKWLDGETLEDNWVRRLLPPGEDGRLPRPWLPGIAVQPLSLAATETGDGGVDADLGIALRAEVISFGADVVGTTKAGLVQAGPFSLGGVGARAMVSLQHVPESGLAAIVGLGVKLSNISLDFTPKKTEERTNLIPFEDDIGDALRAVFAEEDDLLYRNDAEEDGLLYADDEEDDLLHPDDDEEEEDGEEEEDLEHGTRLEDKKYFGKTFSFSLGYRTPDVLDVQLYDPKGRRGKVVWIEIGRRWGREVAGVEASLFLKNLGLQLVGWERTSLSALRERLATRRKEGEKPSGPKVGVRVSGGVRIGPIEIAFIGAGFTVTIDNPPAFQFELDGLDFSLLRPPVRVFGGFVRAERELLGAVCVETPAFSITAVGAFGTHVHEEEVEENGEKKTVKTTVATGFLYGALSAGRGGGIRLGIIRFTGIALGFGINRSVTVPAVNKVADFSLVKLVMGEGGIQEPEEGKSFTDMRQQLAKPPPPPYKILEAMQKEVKPEKDAWFACAGLRFTIAEAADCFALAIVTMGSEGLTIALLGLVRLKLPRAVDGEPLPDPICYIELQLLAALKPAQGLFQFEGQLTRNSWVVSRDCKLTGGFAVRIWFDGPHKGDFVVSLGGYHPRFKRPEHYPVVPRLALRWQVTKELLVKGSLYLAVTPSCFMVGLRFEAVFRTRRLYVCFTVFLDFLLEWAPLHYELDAGLSIRVEVDLALFTLKVSIGAELHLWGPPVGGVVIADLCLFKVEIPFGEPRKPPDLLKSWEEFEAQFLDPAVCQPSLLGGRVPQERDEDWVVRPDELFLGFSTMVPATLLNVGTVRTNSPPEGVMPLGEAGIPRTVRAPVAVDAPAEGVRRGPKVGARPMGRGLESVANVTVVRDTATGAVPVDLTGWVFEETRASMPAGLWDPEKPNPRGPSEPTAKVISDCITGVRGLRPPVGITLGDPSPPFEADTLEPTRLPDRAVPGRDVAAPTPPLEDDAPGILDLEPMLHETLAARGALAGALGDLGFDMPVPASAQRFRTLRARPDRGAVAGRS